MNLTWPILFVVLCHLGCSSAEEIAAVTDDGVAEIFEELLVFQGRLYDLLGREKIAMEKSKNITKELSQLDKDFDDEEKCKADENEDKKYDDTLREVQTKKEEENSQKRGREEELRSVKEQMANISTETDAGEREDKRLENLAKELSDNRTRLHEEKMNKRSLFNGYLVDQHRMLAEGVQEDEGRQQQIDELREELNRMQEVCDGYKREEINTQQSRNELRTKLANLSRTKETLLRRRTVLEEEIRSAQANLTNLENQEADMEEERKEENTRRKEECERKKVELERQIGRTREEKKKAREDVWWIEAHRKWLEKEVREKMEELNQMMEKREKEEEEGNGGRKQLE